LRKKKSLHVTIFRNGKTLNTGVYVSPNEEYSFNYPQETAI